MLSSIICRRAASAVATINRAVAATTITPAAALSSSSLSSLSSSISSSSVLSSSVRHFSSAPQIEEPLEYTPVLKLNMLQDNPGAVKQVSRRKCSKISKQDDYKTEFCFSLVTISIIGCRVLILFSVTFQLSLFFSFDYRLSPPIHILSLSSTLSLLYFCCFRNEL